MLAVLSLWLSAAGTATVLQYSVHSRSFVVQIALSADCSYFNTLLDNISTYKDKDNLPTLRLLSNLALLTLFAVTVMLKVVVLPAPQYIMIAWELSDLAVLTTICCCSGMEEKWPSLLAMRTPSCIPAKRR